MTEQFSNGGFVGIYLANDYNAEPGWLSLVQQWCETFRDES